MITAASRWSLLTVIASLMSAWAVSAWAQLPPAGVDKPDSGSITIQLVPSRASVVVGSTVSFTDYLQGSQNKAVNWLVNGIAGGNATLGTISNAVYTAPATPPLSNSVTVQAQSQQLLSVLSNASTITISNPTPVISSISPDPVPYGAFTLTITGAGFVQGSQVNYGAAALATTFVSATELKAAGTAVPVVGVLIPVSVVSPGTSPITSNTFSVLLSEPKAILSYQAAFHFLEHASFGPTPASIDQVQQIGFQKWLSQQATEPISTFEANAPDIPTLQSDFFYNAMNGPDQLRQRVTLALSEIFVVSAFKNYTPAEFEPYLKILQTDALGNFYTLMNDITLTPTMGHYLDMVDNVQGKNGTLPNENYARELMQLFTTGPVLLNPDGTNQLDSNGNTIPLYTETTVQNFARCYTGWTYPVLPGAAPQSINPVNYVGQMVAWEPNHDMGVKTLLNNVMLPAGQTAEVDTQACLQNVFTHPNVGPFVSTMLIQHLVSSNPSPAYVQRVANVFNNDGTGTRGNLMAVVSAILTDEEARQSDHASTWIPTGGHFREPILFVTSVLRNLNATATGTNGLTGLASIQGQQLFYAASVASYFPPSYPLPGFPTLLGPEFDTLNSSSGLNRVNWINGISWGGTSTTGITLDISAFLPMAADTTGATLIQAVNNTFMAGQMPQPMQTAIAGALTSSSNYPPGQVATAIYLTASSGLYQVQH